MSVWISWSGGKDSTLALYTLRQQGVEVQGALVTLSASAHRITMHGVHEKWLREQLNALGLRAFFHYLPEPAPNDVYIREFRQAVQTLIDQEGLTELVFGDIFLEDLRRFREEMLAPLSVQLRFPLWQKPTSELAKQFVDAGFKAYVVAVMEPPLSKAWLGRTFNRSFLKDLPPGVDPCGERGEFHSFVVDGPLFRRAVPVRPDMQHVYTRDFGATKIHMVELIGNHSPA